MFTQISNRFSGDARGRKDDAEEEAEEEEGHYCRERILDKVSH